MTALLAAAATCSLQVAAAAPAGVPDDSRLASVRPALEAAQERARSAGVAPELVDMLVAGKVREGLAKGAAPDAIRAATERVAAALVEAQAFAVAHRTAAPRLVRALAEARLSGLRLEATEPIVRQGAPPDAVARAVDALAELARRGYPAERAAAVTAALLRVEPGAAGRVVAAIERLRRDGGLTATEALDALGRGLAGGGSVDQALARAASEGRGDDASGGGARGQSGGAHPQGVGPGASAGGGMSKGKGRSGK